MLFDSDNRYHQRRKKVTFDRSAVSSIIICEQRNPPLGTLCALVEQFAADGGLESIRSLFAAADDGSGTISVSDARALLAPLAKAALVIDGRVLAPYVEVAFRIVQSNVQSMRDTDVKADVSMEFNLAQTCTDIGARHTVNQYLHANYHKNLYDGNERKRDEYIERMALAETLIYTALVEIVSLWLTHHRVEGGEHHTHSSVFSRTVGITYR
jgi:hypothetical protein